VQSATKSTTGITWNISAICHFATEHRRCKPTKAYVSNQAKFEYSEDYSVSKEKALIDNSLLQSYSM
jgi:hypothetical protein